MKLNRIILSLMLLFLMATIAYAYSDYPSNIPNNSIVGWWNFDNDTNDHTGYNTAYVDNGVLTYVDGKHGQGAYFNNGPRMNISYNLNMNFFPFRVKSAISIPINPNQGIAFDGTNYYLTQTTKIYKYDLNWNQIANTSYQIGGVDHNGDLGYANGLLYVPEVKWPNCSAWNNSSVAIYYASNLTFKESFAVPAAGVDASAIETDPSNDIMYVTSYCSNKVNKIGLTNHTNISIIALKGEGNISVQGIALYNGSLYISSSTGIYTNAVGNSTVTKTVFKYDLNGNSIDRVFTPPVGEIEGIDGRGPDLLVLNNEAGYNYPGDHVYNTVYDLVPTDGFVVAFWINNSILPSDLGTLSRLVVTDDDGFSIFFRNNPAQLETKLYTKQGTTPRPTVSQTNNIYTGVNQFYAFRYNYTNSNADLFLNSKKLSTVVRDGLSVRSSFNWMVSSGSVFYPIKNAIIDDLMFFNRSLADNEMLMLYLDSTPIYLGINNTIDFNNKITFDNNLSGKTQLNNFSITVSSDNMTIYPTIWNITGDQLIQFREYSPNTIRVKYTIGDRTPNRLYSIKIYWNNGTKYQDFNTLANSTGYISYNLSIGGARYHEIRAIETIDTTFVVTLPAGYTFLRFNASNSTVTNLDPDGQNNSRPIFNITNNGNIIQSFRFYLNGTVANITTYADLDNDHTSRRIEINTSSSIIIPNLNPGSSQNVWMVIDVNKASAINTNKTLTINNS